MTPFPPPPPHSERLMQIGIAHAEMFGRRKGNRYSPLMHYASSLTCVFCASCVFCSSLASSFSFFDHQKIPEMFQL